MKRFLLLILAIIAISSVQASAQGFGITGGMNFNSAEIDDIRMDARIGWNAGVTYGVDLPLGFSLQPALVFTQKSANYSAVEGIQAVQKVNSLTLPVSVQWGPDLIVARPFLDVTPYVGYSLSNKFEGGVTGLFNGETSLKNAFEYGVGLGAGVNIWRLQAVVRYNWNFGTLGSLSDFKEIELDDFDIDDETFGGVSVSLAYFF